MNGRIVANSVLPARREALRLQTSDGLSLVAELALPVRSDPLATVITVHPLPTHGGMMDSHVFRKMAWRLPALADFAVLRFNTRGTSSAAGTSDGAFDSAQGEGLDLRAAIDEVVRRGLPDPWLVGWSFGTDVILKHGDVDPVLGVILLAPPLRFTTMDELAAWDASDRPVVCLVPEFDDYLVPEQARERFSVVRHADVRGIDEGKHLWVGERQVTRVLNEVVGVIAPERAPLPTHWDGPMERWSDL
ncbi:MAG: alpha/beta hydrolase [Actinomycetales bacterium]|nr:alpha/beta hydrolase [Actinomycetales bacterium]